MNFVEQCAKVSMHILILYVPESISVFIPQLRMFVHQSNLKSFYAIEGVNAVVVNSL